MPPSALFVFALVTVAASFQNFPGCLPDEDATIVSESLFPVADTTGPPVIGEVLTNLTLTYYTCPSLQAAQNRRREGTRQSAPIDINGIMDSSAVFASTFHCDQAAASIPTLRDCGNIETIVIDNLIRPMVVVIPALSGLAVSLPNNTCAMVFLNDDANDDYETSLHTIPDMDFDIMEVCPGPFKDGFIGSVRSPVQPGVQNWEVRITASSFLPDSAGTPVNPLRR
ncbi:hypothetical protein B0H16DRAFT_1718649 [Mycena metata]|uniref:Uncharacterized protein n=1 Tax=Mycena metata TaxID=1033252 RepID=A0AAD7NJ73_9AGAR|nr:hypothetical protein B0H16DRAFT_1718649 [Mycena metata]